MILGITLTFPKTVLRGKETMRCYTSADVVAVARFFSLSLNEGISATIMMVQSTPRREFTERFPIRTLAAYRLTGSILSGVSPWSATMAIFGHCFF